MTEGTFLTILILFTFIGVQWFYFRDKIKEKQEAIRYLVLERDAARTGRGAYMIYYESAIKERESYRRELLELQAERSEHNRDLGVES